MTAPLSPLAFLGTGDFGVGALRALHAAGFPIVAVISQPDRPAGRGRETAPTPIRAAALDLGLPHAATEDVNAPTQVEQLSRAALGVVAAFGQKLGPTLLSATRLGFINIHASLLPRYRGAAPFQHAILDGAESSGVTIFQLDQRWDAGPIWAQRAAPIGPTQTADELHDALAIVGADMIVATVQDLLAGRAVPTVQDAAAATRAPKLSKADGFVDWSAPAARCVRRVNGLWSWPAAACRFVSRSGRDERVLLARAELANDAAPANETTPPGAFLSDGCVQCGVGRLRVLDIQPAGGKKMPFAAFANGRKLDVGDRLERIEP